jgi:hypothetical protein
MRLYLVREVRSRENISKMRGREYIYGKEPVERENNDTGEKGNYRGNGPKQVKGCGQEQGIFFVQQEGRWVDDLRVHGTGVLF